MKQILTLFLLLAVICSLHAQDLIIKKDNQGKKVKILEVTSKTIRYKQFENLEGPEHNIDIDDILVIVYENGHYQSFYNVDGKQLKDSGDEKTKGEKVGPYGRRTLRQLGYVVMYSESTSNFENASRYGINYSVGHIKDERPVGYLFEMGMNLFKQGLYEEEEKVLDNYNLMLSIMFGTIVKIYKREKLLVYGKAAFGGIVSASVLKEPEEFFSYNTYKLNYNYNLALGVNYKLTKKFGLYAEGGYSRIQVLQAGISFMID